MPWDFALILLVLGVVVPWHGTLRVRHLLRAAQTSSEDRLAIYASTIAFQWALTALIVWRSFERGLTSSALGLVTPRDPMALAAAAALTLLICVNQVASLRRLATLPAEQRGLVGALAHKLLPQNSIEALAFIALAVTVGICEELIYRGFVFAAFERLGGLFLAVGVSSLLFAAAHVYQGARGMLVTFVIGLLFAGLRIWTSSLLPVMLAHTATDLVAGLLAPRLLRPLK